MSGPGFGADVVAPASRARGAKLEVSLHGRLERRSGARTQSAFKIAICDYGAKPKEAPVSIDVQALKEERDRIKETLRQLENEQRKLESEQKQLRQQEIRSKRMLEALDTLINIQSDSDESSSPRDAANP